MQIRTKRLCHLLVYLNLACLTTLKGPSQPHVCFFFTCESLAIIFDSEHVETKEITVKLLN